VLPAGKETPGNQIPITIPKPYCEPINASVAFRIADGNASHAAITCCKSASSDDRQRQLGPPECSARAAHGCWHLRQPQQQFEVGSEQDAGSIPAASTLPLVSRWRRWPADLRRGARHSCWRFSVGTRLVPGELISSGQLTSGEAIARCLLGTFKFGVEKGVRNRPDSVSDDFALPRAPRVPVSSRRFPRLWWQKKRGSGGRRFIPQSSLRSRLLRLRGSVISVLEG